ncbi:CCA tRNA nucleotidyltransferase [Paenibacillus sp. S150]|uniref:CCA tRNA nucleotidyltransferase n=1 Tax=Paenibacillus sp. S150 TaxID=2749826 RepID=UPI001C59DBC6|nr:CCA tRNA nucleotidyltransferase [Paenibacillus sp. S150]MBW4085363.1 CCA tRNA nucleotidyltransferase [Paenibacillus sp. S150]
MEWTMAPSGMAEAAGGVISALLAHGHEAYFVGGCIRDELLGRPVHDIDLTTSALPGEVMDIFPRCVPTGLAHGTITVLQNGWSFEVTTYRTESAYTDHRRPGHVLFVSDVKEDLRRRDFTINAMCCGPDGILVDPFGGEEDSRRRLVRCVGDAEERFDEDALRMLRCVRFASVLDFSIAKNTWRGLLRQRDKLAHIAVERVRAELDRIVLGPHPQRGLGLLARSGLLPRGKAPFPWTGSDMAAAAALTAGIGDLQDARLRWALLLHALKRSAGEADELLRAWTFPGATRSAVAGVLRVREAWSAALAQVPPGEPGGTEALRRRWIAAVLAHGQSAAEGWLTLLSALPQAAVPVAPDCGAPAVQRPDAPDLPMLRSWTAAMPLHKLAELAVTGKELADALEKRPGPWLGVLLQSLLLAVAAGELPNNNQLLLLEAKRMDRDEQ